MNINSIQEITAFDVLGEFNYHIPFETGLDSDRMRLIYAPNGRGKTNFLQAVDCILEPHFFSLQRLIEVPVRMIRIGVIHNKWLVLRRGGQLLGSYELSVEDYSKPDNERVIANLAVDPNDFEGRLAQRLWERRPETQEFTEIVRKLSPGAKYLGADRLTIDVAKNGNDVQISEVVREADDSKRLISGLLTLVQNIFTQMALEGLSSEGEQSEVYSAITASALSGRDPSTAADAREELSRQIETLLEKGELLEDYGLISLKQVRNINKQIAEARANAHQLKALSTVLTPYFDSLREQITNLEPSRREIDQYISSINHFLDRKEISFFARTGIALLSRDGTPLDPDELSSGEKQLILLISHAVIAAGRSGLVIIDEPELSLGIDWQRDLLPNLLACSQWSGVQFLVASHSLQVMDSVDTDKIVTPSEADIA